MDDQRLEEIAKRVDAATEGPWRAVVSEDYGRPTSFGWVAASSGEVMGEASAAGLLSDAEFIAHARTDVPYLLEALRSLREERDEAMVRPPLASEQAKAALRLRAASKERCRELIKRAESAEATAADMQRSLEYANAQWRSGQAALNRRIDERDKAEAELHRLREGISALDRYNCDCLPNDPTDTRMATNEEAAHADVLSCQRFVVLDADVERLLASSVEEKPESRTEP
jgi:hypothetical protein